jgi:hypothetical protein
MEDLVTFAVLNSSLPGLTWQSMQRRGSMDAQVKPAYDE